MEQAATRRPELRLLGLLALWLAAFLSLGPLSRWVVGGALRLTFGSRPAAAVEFFLYDSGRLMLWLALVLFLMGILRTFLTPRHMRRLLTGRGETAGIFLAALLGIATPFCTCSAVPLFIGFVTAGLPLSVSFSFLVCAPMVNEVALVLLFGLLGWKVALLYAATGFSIAVVSGWAIGRLGMERHVEGWVWETAGKLRLSPDSESISAELEGPAPDWAGRVRIAEGTTREIVAQVWPFILAGIAVGAGIYGYVPTASMAAIMGKSAWWSVPAAVAIGIPLYSTAAGMIPVVQALLEKGAALGTCLAFMMAVIGLSLPEVVILRKVLKPRLLGVFLGIVASGIVAVGYLFNLLF
jgi:uncharacterized membrane protein YraQ (UPF0718 family)